MCLPIPTHTFLEAVVTGFDLALRIENKIKPRIFDEKRGIAALLIENSGFYFIREPKDRKSSNLQILELLGNKTLFSTGVRGFPISPLSLCCIQI